MTDDHGYGRGCGYGHVNGCENDHGCVNVRDHANDHVNDCARRKYVVGLPSIPWRQQKNVRVRDGDGPVRAVAFREL